MIESFVFLFEWKFSCKLERNHGQPLLSFLDKLATWSDVAEVVVLH